jgi:hypothetical protein
MCYSSSGRERSLAKAFKASIKGFWASDTMFVSRREFDDYKTIPPRSGDSAKAVFEIVGEGTVVKSYLVDGKQRKLTYTHAIHTPILNANFVSVSAFDRAGLTVTGGRGVWHRKS